MIGKSNYVIVAGTFFFFSFQRFLFVSVSKRLVFKSFVYHHDFRSYFPLNNDTTRSYLALFKDTDCFSKHRIISVSDQA